MKKQVRKLFVAAVLFMAGSVSANAGTDKAIEVSQLPAAAQQILKAHFPGKKVALAKQETELFGKDYDVIFTDGSKIEFDKNGDWISIDCQLKAVPEKLIPEKILLKVRDLNPDVYVTEIERDRKGYEVELSNRTELLFNNQQVLAKIKKK